MEPANLYAPPEQQDVALPTTGPDAALEAIRRQHLGRETNIKAVGGLAILGAIGCIVTGLNALTVSAVQAAIVLASGVGLFLAGARLRKLEPLGRTIYTVVASVGMAGQLIAWFQTHDGSGLLGIGITLAILSILWRGNAAVVFSDHYRHVVVPATPHVKYRTPVWVWAVLALVLMGVAAAIVAGLRH